MKKFLKVKNFWLVAFSLSLIVFANVQTVRADTVTDNAVNFLKSKQDATGRITTGFSAPSQWSAIAFTAAGVDVATVKNPTVSLKDFLLTDIPADSSSATEFETRILAIVAIGENPTSFGGSNLVGSLESKYDGTQIGDSCSLNDDIFGLLALVASGTLSTTTVKQGTLDFIISKQDADGGFGFSAPGCDWYSTSADMTGAGIQALQAAKDNGLTNAGLDTAIVSAKNYLLSNQNADGGFGYFGSSDTDSAGWVLMGLNAIGMESSTEATNARNYLISQQSASDGGITAFDWGSSTFVSNASTTAQALIGLLGKSWILKIYTPVIPTPTVTIAPTNIPTATPTPTPTPSSSSNSSSSSSPTSAPTPTAPPADGPTATPAGQSPLGGVQNQFFTTNTNDESVDEPSPTPSEEVLGTQTQDSNSNGETKVAGASNFKPLFIKIFLVIGFASFAGWLLIKYYKKAL